MGVGYLEGFQPANNSEVGTLSTSETPQHMNLHSDSHLVPSHDADATNSIVSAPFSVTRIGIGRGIPLYAWVSPCPIALSESGVRTNGNYLTSLPPLTEKGLITVTLRKTVILHRHDYPTTVVHVSGRILVSIILRICIVSSMG